MRVARPIGLSEEQRAKLAAYARGRSLAKRVVERASIVLQAAEGKQDREIAANLRVGRHTVARWRARFLEAGLAGIEKDASRPGRARTIDPGRNRSQNHAREACQRDALEHPNDGARAGHQRGQRSTGVADTRTQTSFGGNVQGQPRSSIR